MEKTIRILFCDDNADDVGLMQLELDKAKLNYESLLVEAKIEFSNALLDFHPDIILCDYTMPSFNGMDAFNILKQSNLHIPFIVVTGTINEELALNFLNAGVDDFILKNSYGRIPSAINKAIEKKSIEKTSIQTQANLKAIFDATSEGFILTDENLMIKSFNAKALQLIEKATSKVLKDGKNLFDFIAYSEKELIKKKSEKFSSGLTIYYNERYYLKSGYPIWYNYSIDFVQIDDKINGVCVTLRDVTELKTAEDRIIKANRMFAFISEINHIMVQVEDEQTLYSKACDLATEYGKFKVSWIGSVDIQNKTLTLIEHSGALAEEVKYFQNRSFVKEGPIEFILENNTYFLSNDFQHDERLKSWWPMAVSRNVQSCLILPIHKSGKIIATYNLYSPVLNFFVDDEIVLLEEVAANISFTLDIFEKEKQRQVAEEELQKRNKQLRLLSSLLQNIREEERMHISREIHDELGQQLTALKMDIGWIQHKNKSFDSEVAAKLNEMLEFSDTLIKTVRRISSELRPAIIDDLGLVAALEWKCNDFQEKQGINCSFTSSLKERKFESNFSITVFRILQETLTNVLRHANAKNVTVALSETKKQLILDITDDGKGIDTKLLENSKTLGVLGMKERANLLGGELIIEGEKNKGSHSKLILPFES